MNDDFEPLSNIEMLFDIPLPRSSRRGRQSAINKIAAHLDVIDIKSKGIISSRGWTLFEIAYEYIGGFKSYVDAAEMASKAYLLRATYDGKLDDINDFEVEKCYAIAVYNLKFGLKLTGLVKNLVTTDRMKTTAAARKLQQDSMRISWFECSGKAESFVMATGGRNHIIDPKIIRDKVYPNEEVVISPDGIHYKRKLKVGGQVVEKIAVGNIKI